MDGSGSKMDDELPTPSTDQNAEEGPLLTTPVSLQVASTESSKAADEGGLFRVNVSAALHRSVDPETVGIEESDWRYV